MLLPLMWMLGALVYATVGVAVGSVFMYKNRESVLGANAGGEAQVFCTACGVFWPITLIVGSAVVICVMIYMAMKTTTLRIGMRKNRAKILASEIEMREDDLERVGGKLELALRYSYEPCTTCLGGGCKECQGKGVLRVHERGASRDYTKYGWR